MTIHFSRKRSKQLLLGNGSNLEKLWYRLSWSIFVLIVLVFGVNGVRADEGGVVYGEAHQMHYAQEEDSNTGTLMFSNQKGKLSQGVLLDMQLDISVSGLVIRANVKQIFKNTSDQWQEGIYRFPLPETAAVDHLKMKIGDREIIGEIQEKKRAEMNYQKAKKEGKKVSVVHQQRANLFTTKVANVAPHETVEIEISYLQKLDYQKGEFNLRFPMTITPRYIPGHPSYLNSATELNGWGFNTDEVADAMAITPPQIHLKELSLNNGRPTNHASINIRLDAGLPLAKIQSLFHDMDIQRQGHIYDLSLKEGRVPMDRDFVLNWKPSLSHEPQLAFFSEEWQNTHYGLLMVMPPRQLHEQAYVLPRNITFILDTSGSMGGASIRQAREALIYALDRLKPTDSFNIIEFNSTARALFEIEHVAEHAAIQSAKRFVQGLDANGGTEIRKALNLAFDLMNNSSEINHVVQKQIIFMTDGSIGNEDSLFQLIKNKIKDTRLFTVGIGSAPNSFFMRKAAEFGHGTFTHIGDLQHVETEMKKLFVKIESPQLTNIQVFSDTNPDLDIHPQVVSDLYRNEPLVLLLRSQHLIESVFVEGVARQMPWRKEVRLKARNSPGVAMLFGREKIERLEDERVVNNTERLNEEILNTALHYEIVSRHTSLIAVEHIVSRIPEEQLNSVSLPSLMPKGSTMSAPNLVAKTMSFPATASPALEHFEQAFRYLYIALFVCLIYVASHCYRRFV